MKKNRKLFMLEKLRRDLFSSPPKTFCSHGKNLGYYYLIFLDKKAKLNRLIVAFDEDGVPINDSYIDVKNGKPHYYPITIGQYGLAIFHSWINSNALIKKNLFLNIAKWFEQNVAFSENLGAFWLTDVSKPEFGVFSPWKSAFTQSRAISILLRAWQMTGNSNYLKLASEAIIPFTISTEKGGVAVDLTEEIAFYEEYVAEKPTRILDGAIFSLFGIYDFIRATKELPGLEESHEIAKEIFRKGINGLKYWLPKFDMGYWVFYNRCEIEGYPQNDPCTIGYLRLVAAQLEIISNLTGEKIFKEYSYKFKGYLKPWNILKMYREKYIALKKLNRI